MGRKNSGFTLVELLVVIAFLAIIAVIIINALRSSLWKGNDAKRKADLDRIKIALEEYEKDHNCYPPVGSMKLCGTDATIAIHPYLSNVPCDPITHAAYYYEPDPNAPVCVDWYRMYAILQYTADSAAISGIGYNSLYNYYIRSPNAPPIATPPGPTSSPPSSSPPLSNYWGCISGSCQPVPLDANGNPTCSPVFDNPQCNGNDCSAPNAPACFTKQQRERL